MSRQSAVSLTLSTTAATHLAASVSHAAVSARIFLLSPAHCGGERARLVLRNEARFDLARRLRTPEGAALGEVFSFLSGLYFRGKLTYASSFARPPAGVAGVLVITPCEGLQPPDLRVGVPHLQRYAKVDIAADDRRYREPLLRDARSLLGSLEKLPGVGGHPPGQRGERQVRRPADAGVRRAPPVSGGLRRTRRHEPRRPAPPLRQRGSRARLPAARRYPAARASTSSASAPAGNSPERGRGSPRRASRGDRRNRARSPGRPTSCVGVPSRPSPEPPTGRWRWPVSGW